MRLRLLGCAMAGGLGLLASTAFGSDAAQQRGKHMASWETSATWRRYKAYWGEIPTAKSPTSLKALATGIEKLGLERLFPSSPELAENLHASLTDRVDARSEIVSRFIWRGDKRVGEKRLPHHPEDDLGPSVQMLVHDTGALRGLRALKATDPWIEGTLAPAVERGCQIVESQLASGGDEAAARAALQSARALLAEGKTGH
jgi:hypothetical protein